MSTEKFNDIHPISEPLIRHDNYQIALSLAVDSAGHHQPTYWKPDGFFPHYWVIDAVLRGIEFGQGQSTHEFDAESVNGLIGEQMTAREPTKVIMIATKAGIKRVGFASAGYAALTNCYRHGFEDGVASTTTLRTEASPRPEGASRTELDEAIAAVVKMLDGLHADSSAVPAVNNHLEQLLKHRLNLITKPVWCGMDFGSGDFSSIGIVGSDAYKAGQARTNQEFKAAVNSIHVRQNGQARAMATGMDKAAAQALIDSGPSISELE